MNSYVFLEAQAAGKPVVVGRNGGVPETMVEGETGLLVGGEDVAETAAALRRLVEDRGLRARMGEAGRRHVVDHFSWARAARAVEDVHRQVLEAGTLRAARGPVALSRAPRPPGEFVPTRDMVRRRRGPAGVRRAGPDLHRQLTRPSAGVNGH